MIKKRLGKRSRKRKVKMTYEMGYKHGHNDGYREGYDDGLSHIIEVERLLSEFKRAAAEVKLNINNDDDNGFVN